MHADIHVQDERKEDDALREAKMHGQDVGGKHEDQYSKS